MHLFASGCCSSSSARSRSRLLPEPLESSEVLILSDEVTEVEAPLWRKLSWQDAAESDNENPVEGKEHLQRALAKIDKDSMRYQRSLTKQWLGKNGEVLWSKSRVCLAKLVMSQSFETFMGLVIFANLVLTIVETNSIAACYPEYAQQLETCPQRNTAQSWLQVCTIFFQVIYTIECGLRAYVERASFVWNKLNQIDLWISILGWIAVAPLNVVNLNILRILRVVRLIRVGRLVISVPELYILLSGLTTSCLGVVWVVAGLENVGFLPKNA
eukprot:s3523_g4.t1